MTRIDAVNYILYGVIKSPHGQDVIYEPTIVLSEEITGRYANPDEKTSRTKVTEPAAGPQRRVFISYSHRDKRWISRLEVHLRPIVKTGMITHWHDGLIVPGSKWQAEIRLAIEAASIAILMVSADFLASEFILRNELPPLLKAAEERGCHILSIIVGPCRFSKTPDLAEFQAVNSPSRPLSAINVHDRETVFARVAETIETILQPDIT